MPKRTIAQPVERSRRNWFSVPESLYLAAKVECARRGVPIRYALVIGLQLFLEDSANFRKYCEQEAKSHPRIVKGRGTGYYAGVTREEVTSEPISKQFRIKR